MLDLNCAASLQQRRSVILHTVASVLLFAFATSSLAAEVPGDLLGTWSTDSVCNLNARPNEAFIYTFGPKYISYYEIECLIQDVKPGLDKVDFNLDCFKGGGFRYFDKLRVQRPSSDKLSLTFKFPSQGDSQLVYRCSHEVPEVERRTGEKITRWMHNNSLVTLNEADHTLEIDYETPRPGMMAVGVRQGTMLFFGTRTGAEIEGVAYIFNHQCGPLGYKVRGEMLDAENLLLLMGLSPKVNSKCDPVGKAPDTLRFERLR